MSKKKFKTQYKDLPSIEKRLDELIEQDSKRKLSFKEEYEYRNLITIARKLRYTPDLPGLLELRNNKIEKIKQNMGV